MYYQKNPNIPEEKQKNKQQTSAKLTPVCILLSSGILVFGVLRVNGVFIVSVLHFSYDKTYLMSLLSPKMRKYLRILDKVKNKLLID